MTIPCNGCGYCAKNNQGLSRHQSACLKSKFLLGSILAKRKQKLEDERATKVMKMVEGQDANLVSTYFNHSNSHTDTQKFKEIVSTPISEPSSPNQIVYKSWTGRIVRHPRIFKDMIPALSTPLPFMPITETPQPLVQHNSPSPSPSPPQQTPPPPEIHDTEPNTFGVYQSYTKFPCQDPKDEQTLDNLCEFSWTSNCTQISGSTLVDWTCAMTNPYHFFRAFSQYFCLSFDALVLFLTY